MSVYIKMRVGYRERGNHVNNISILTVNLYYFNHKVFNGTIIYVKPCSNTFHSAYKLTTLNHMYLIQSSKQINLE